MKAEFELDIDEITGLPIIKFKHYDRSNTLQQNLLAMFVKHAQKRGLYITNPNGHLESGTEKSWENYEIKIN